MIRVPFASSGGDGYASGSVGLQYAFLGCYGELHLALRLAPNSVQTNGVYRMGGKTYVADAAPTQLSVIKVRGRAARAGSEIIGDFTNGAVGPEGGLGCFSGDLTQLGVLTRWLGPKPTPEQVVNFLNSLTLQVEPIEAPRNAGVEAKLRSEERQKQAAIEAQQKARQQEAEAKRAAEAKRVEDAKRPISPTPTGAGGGYQPTTPRTDRPPVAAQPSQAERTAKAIESDRLLAQQRLAQQQQQYNQFQQQMAANEAESRRQAQAVIDAAPALIGLGGALQNWSDGIVQRQYLNAQQKLGGTCYLANGAIAPKDGELVLGVEKASALTKNDCGANAGSRFKAFRLEVPEASRVRLTVANGRPWSFTSFQVEVRDLNAKVLLDINWREWGGLQQSLTKSVDLPPGIYIVPVWNGSEGIFAPFKLKVEAIGADGRPLPPVRQAIASASNAGPEAPVAGRSGTAPPAAAGTSQAAPGGNPNPASAQLWGTLAELAGREWSAAGMSAEPRQRFVWSDGGRTLLWQVASRDGPWSDWYIFNQTGEEVSVRLAGGRSRGTVSVDPSGVAVARVGSLGATTRFTRSGDGFEVVYRPIPVTWHLTPASNSMAAK
jgi:hypothetical protein